MAGITRQQRREEALFRMRARAPDLESTKSVLDTDKQVFLPLEYSERLEDAPLHVHHYMSREVTSENRLNLATWIAANRNDPALKV